MQREQELFRENRYKLKKMRWIATGLLLLMALIYIVFKRFETYHLSFSFIVAFAEAAMIGALADWFAVVALFKHPMGMKWIPHTAIIPNNKERIGESISNFVVSNFFTAEVLEERLKTINPVDEALKQLNKSRSAIAEAVINNFSSMVKALFESGEMAAIAGSTLKSGLRGIKLYPSLGGILESLVTSGRHFPLAKELLLHLYNYISENRDATLKFLENMHRTLALPLIGDLIFKNILKVLQRQIDELENENTEINKLLSYSLPKLAGELKTSEELIQKGEQFKNEMLDSELLGSIVNKSMNDIKEQLLLYGQKPRQEFEEKINGFIDMLIERFLGAEALKGTVDAAVRKGITGVVSTYREEIGRYIFNTVKAWETEDMVDRLETHVGADLQYIRINGTVVGGLAGLIIHTLTLLF